MHEKERGEGKKAIEFLRKRPERTHRKKKRKNSDLRKGASKSGRVGKFASSEWIGEKNCGYSLR